MIILFITANAWWLQPFETTAYQRKRGDYVFKIYFRVKSDEAIRSGNCWVLNIVIEMTNETPSFSSSAEEAE